MPELAVRRRRDGPPPDRVRARRRPRCDTAADLPGETYLDARPPVDDGRIELLRYVREQAVSRTLHRFGNLQGISPPSAG